MHTYNIGKKAHFSSIKKLYLKLQCSHFSIFDMLNTRHLFLHIFGSDFWPCLSVYFLFILQKMQFKTWSRISSYDEYKKNAAFETWVWQLTLLLVRDSRLPVEQTKWLLARGSCLCFGLYSLLCIPGRFAKWTVAIVTASCDRNRIPMCCCCHRTFNCDQFADWSAK